PGPQPSSPAIPAPHIADAAARTVVHLSGLPPATPPVPEKVASPEPQGLDRTVVFTPVPPGPAPDSGVASRRAQATLVPIKVADGSGGHPLADENTLGRVAENSIRIQQGSVSRHHAILRFTAEGWMLEDLKTENGTWVNGDRIEKRRLADGDRVNIGTVRFMFRIG
ncbi:MAG: FHA domain-containing protein, partial [Thermoanaerobaculia bacterium]